MESWFRLLAQNGTPRTGFFNVGNIDISGWTPLWRAVHYNPGLS